MLRYPKHRTPPFEVMRYGQAGSSAAGRKANVDPSPGSGSSDGTEQGAGGDWRKRGGYPVVLRIPRGYALLLGIAAAGLLVLAYRTGFTRGYRAGEGLATDSFPPMAAHSVERPIEPVRERNVEAGTPVTKSHVEPVRVAKGGDARQVGLNYYVLAHYPRAEALKLVEFLWEQGVATAGYRPENRQFFQVIALQGFTREQIGGPGPNAFRQKLHRLGRLWVKKNKGAEDFSQSGIYLAKYKGGQYAEVITRKTMSHEH